MVFIYKWSLYTGGLYRQVVFIDRWSLYTGGLYGLCVQFELYVK